MTRLLLVLLLLVAGCEDRIQAISTQAVKAEDGDVLEVSLIIQRDGCNVYRFQDAGYPRYFVTCPKAGTGSTVSSESHTSGKVTIRIPVETVTVRP